METSKRELGMFLVAGFSAVGTDMASYFLLINFLNENISKGSSFVLGTIVAYLLNKYLTFQKKGRSMIEVVKFGILYAGTLTVNITVNRLSLNYLTEAYILAFLSATGTSTVLNFLGQKFWVFR